MDAITAAIRKRTCHIIAARFKLENERHERQKLMALQIKGLRENMMALRTLVTDLNGSAAGAIEKGTQLKGHIGDLAKELGDHVSDIEFAAGIMGNSGGGSNGSGRPVERSISTAGDLTGPKEQNLTATIPAVRLGPNPSLPEANFRSLQSGEDPNLSPGDIIDEIQFKEGAKLTINPDQTVRIDPPVPEAGQPKPMPETTEGAIWAPGSFRNEV
jgi:hypothetical protein